MPVLLTPDASIDPNVDVRKFPTERIYPRIVDWWNAAVFPRAVQTIQNTFSSMEIESLANRPQAFDEGRYEFQIVQVVDSYPALDRNGRSLFVIAGFLGRNAVFHAF